MKKNGQYVGVDEKYVPEDEKYVANTEKQEKRQKKYTLLYLLPICLIMLFAIVMFIFIFSKIITRV